MKHHLSTWKSSFITVIFLLHLDAIEGVSNGYAISLNGAKSASLYRAPSYYSKENPLHSFIITSRPINFHADQHKQEGNSLKSTLIQTKGKGSLTSVPGIATVVCKGISCASSATSFLDWPSEDDGFPGEAIPVDEAEYMTAMVGQHQLQGVVSASKVKQSSTHSKVHLLTNRPYLRRGSSKPKISAPTRKTYVERRSTTATSTSTTPPPPPATTRRRPVAQAQVASTTPMPAVSTIQPTIMFQRPSLVFPAIAALGLMALPVAAAAVPLFLQGRRRRRSLPVMAHASPDDFTAFSDADLRELMSSLEDLENGNERMEWPVGHRHLAKVKKARHRLQKLGKQSRRR